MDVARAGHGRHHHVRDGHLGPGALLYAILTGDQPYEGPLNYVIEAAASGQFRPVIAMEPDAPSALAAIATRAMAPSAVDRYGTAADLAAEVRAWQSGRRVTAHDYTVGEAVALLLRRLRWWLLGAVVAAVLGAVAGGSR